MAREVGTLKLGLLSAALIGGLALPAQAEELTLGGTATFTTDYVFRGISNTTQNPAVQASLDASYGIFYLGMWGSNVDFGGGPYGQDLANLEIDYYAGITPEWKGISFDIAGLYYTYPGAYDPGGNFDYFELKTGASYTFGEAFTFGVTNYWSPEFFGETGDADALELSGEYAFSNKWWIFTPSVSGLIGWQWTESADYTYWNAGLTLGFMENWSADIRYWDTDFSDAGCAAFSGFTNNCDSRVVGTISASF
ncbi:MAG TPA: TorF family putative porin [Methyloceanibacter sp.]|nr:TorF family putative porin [Methyloceanibacter sp.]